MTNKEFDDAIRRKILSVPLPPVTKEQVDAVYDAIEKKRRKIKRSAWYKKWIPFIAFLLCIIVILGLLYRMFNLNIAVKALSREVVELKEHAGQIKDQAKEENKVENNVEDKNELEVENHKLLILPEFSSKQKASSENTNNPPPVTKQQVPIAVLPKDTTPPVAKEKNDIQEIPLAPVNIHLALFVFSISKIIQPNEPEGTEVRMKASHKLNLASATGIGFDLGSSYISYGLVEDISFLKHWSITTGIKYSITYHEKFLDEDEFFRKKNKAFTHIYDPDGYNYGILDIKNIDIQTKIFQVPLFINYKIGLKNDFNLLLSAGTNFVISSSQNVKFNNTLSGPISVLNTVSFVNHYIGPMFRDINISVGLQYVGKGYSIDASPNLGVMINNPNNDKRVNGGVRVRLMFGI